MILLLSLIFHWKTAMTLLVSKWVPEMSLVLYKWAIEYWSYDLHMPVRQVYIEPILAYEQETKTEQKTE